MRSGLSQIGTLCLNNSEAAIHFDLHLLALPHPHSWVLYTFFKTYFDIETVSKTLYIFYTPQFGEDSIMASPAIFKFVAIVMSCTGPRLDPLRSFEFIIVPKQYLEVGGFEG